MFTTKHLLILTPANDRVVKIWSPFTGELIRNLNGHTKGLSDIAWSSDSVYLASASDDHTVRIWDVDSVRAMHVSRCAPHHSSSHGIIRVLPRECSRGTRAMYFALTIIWPPPFWYLEGVTATFGYGTRRKVTTADLPRNPSHFCGETGKCIKTIHAHLDYVTAVHFNRDAGLIVSCALDGLM